MTVKAKFRVNGIFHGYGVDSSMVQLTAVYGTEGENKDFTNATPWGNLNMGIDNTAPALQFFQDNLYKDIYLTFEKGPENDKR